MHEWHTKSGRNPLDLIGEFENFEYDTDFGRDNVKDVYITGNVLANKEEAINFVTNKSYGGSTAYMASYSPNKITKACKNAFNSFLEKHKEYVSFRDNLTIAYGRKSSKATCPTCGSSINLKYGNKFRSCPVCGSKKIISDSNWKTLETKHKMCVKAAESLSKEAEKNDLTFVCGIEWHC